MGIWVESIRGESKERERKKEREVGGVRVRRLEVGGGMEIELVGYVNVYVTALIRAEAARDGTC